NLKLSSPKWDLLKFQVREALEEYDYFEASFDQLLELQRPFLKALKQLIDLPFQIKQLANPFVPMLGLYQDCMRAYPLMMHIFKSLAPFTLLALGLEKTILRMILESFSLEKYMDELVDSTNNHLRAMKYGRINTSELTHGVPAHCDHTTMTLLCQLNEVQKVNFVLLQVWLNGQLTVVYHRMMMKGNETSYSIRVFASPREGYLVKVPKELVDDKNPMLFKPFDLEEVLKFYYLQTVQVATKSTIKAYCNV
ncbi:hypothetical protein Gotri_019238, partial [Gossypium trilobum]|nr:hypothetical protein [Gossypium trilobum]